jgi:hypothetical protein
MQVGFYVPAAPNNTYMTNNVEVDNRGYIYIVDASAMEWTSETHRVRLAYRRQGFRL